MQTIQHSIVEVPNAAFIRATAVSFGARGLVDIEEQEQVVQLLGYGISNKATRNNGQIEKGSGIVGW